MNVTAMAERAEQHDREASFPKADFDDLRAEGLLGLMVPERLGGKGAGFLTYAETAYELAQGNAATALIFNMHCCVTGALAATPDELARAMGAPEVLPPETVTVLKQAEEDSRDRPGATVNLAVGYGGRREIADAVRSLLAEHAERGTSLDELVEVLDVEHIAEHLYTRGQPDPDLVIRTSGEQRMSGFLLWQTANAEFHFTDVYWPDFRRADFLRALRDYARRHRRFGG